MKLKLILIASTLLSLTLFAQDVTVNISGTILDKSSQSEMPFANVVIKNAADSAFVTGTITNEVGDFTIPDLPTGSYVIEVSLVGYKLMKTPVFVGGNTPYLDLGNLLVEEAIEELGEVTIVDDQNRLSSQMDKKIYFVDNNFSQAGGSVLQAMQNLPGVTMQDGEVSLRGNSQVVFLIDGKQTAITGFGKQNGLDNLPVASVERIEIINNPSAKFDANGNAGIINIVMRKQEEKGFNGRVGISGGLGALWVRKENLPDIRPQYQSTPKINPSLSLNYRKNKLNFFLQADNLYTETLNKNEFVTRTYDDGTIIKQQLKRNRDTNLFTSKAGVDLVIDEQNSLTLSGFYSRESIIDKGDQPFFNENLSQRQRLWQFLEDEVLTAVMVSADYQHKFNSPGHLIDFSLNYTFDREDEKYFFDNTLPTFSSKERFELIADQKVFDFTADYALPLKHGMFESGVKFRRRNIPTNMEFFPGTNSPLDPDADGKATYIETIPSLYGTYSYQVRSLEAEVGLRVEYVDLQYEVDPNHNTYSSDGYDYFQPFPNLRLTYSLSTNNKLSIFYNRRVDRPDEGDIRIFPKYDDAEIIKVGNPGLRPQFTDLFELGYRYIWGSGELYAAGYYKASDGTITRISTTAPGSNLIYTVFQNIGTSYNTGLEVLVTQDVSDFLVLSLNGNVYGNQIEAYVLENKYPVPTTFDFERQSTTSGNLKFNASLKFSKTSEFQFSAVYLAPDIIPQGKIDERFSMDLGLKQTIQKGKGELFLNATDLLNTMVIRKDIIGNNFSYTSDDYYETQVIRLGYFYSF